MKNNTSEIQMKKIADGKLTAQEVLEEANAPKSTFMKLFTRVDSELSMGGWNLVAILLCVIFDCLDLYVLFYALYYPAIFVASTIYLIKKTRCLKK